MHIIHARRALLLVCLLLIGANGQPAFAEEPKEEPKVVTATDSLRLQVVDEQGKPVPSFEIMTHTADHGYSLWKAGKDGSASLDPLSEAGVVDIVVRSPDHASTITRFEGEMLKKLKDGDAKITLERGDSAELRFRLPEGKAWPDDVMPEVYFEDLQDRVRMMRQPSNRRGDVPDFNMLGIRAVGKGRFALRLAKDTPRFCVAIHAPGFLQFFEAGTFAQSDLKDGALEVDVPRPARLKINFATESAHLDKLPFEGVAFSVYQKPPDAKGMYSLTDRAAGTSDKRVLELTDLAPADFTVMLRTTPKVDAEKPEAAILRRGDINPGSFSDYKELALSAGQSESVDFKFKPFDPDAFRGDRTAVLKIVQPDGMPAAGRELSVTYYDGHYGMLPVFTGKVPESGEVKIEKITGRVPGSRKGIEPYAVNLVKDGTDTERLGAFSFTKTEPLEQFQFQLPPDAGDAAPDVSFENVSTGKTVKVSDFRGKVVCLEFWATWCGPCQPAMEKMNFLVGDHAEDWKDRVAVVPVSIDDQSKAPKKHLVTRGWSNLECYWSGKGEDGGWSSPAARAFVINGVPTSFVIDREGKILWRGHPLDTTGGQDLKSRIAAAIEH